MKKTVEYITTELTQWPQMDTPRIIGGWKKIALGERLSDPILSSTVLSAAPLVTRAYAMADNLSVSPGVENRLGKRNSPSLWNIGFHPYFMREGGVPSLEMQVLVPIQEHTEMGFNMVLLADRLNADSSYKNEFIEAFSDSATSFTITRAIAQYERTLVSSDAPLDAYIAGTDDAISDEAKNGLTLLREANCSHCHSGPLFTDFGFITMGQLLIQMITEEQN